MYYTKDIIIGPDGKPTFIGKEQPSPTVKKEGGSQMQCPVCNGWFDYLVGDDTPNGGVRGCEKCWKAPKEGVRHEAETNSEEII